jgi:hypothetical protein
MFLRSLLLTHREHIHLLDKDSLFGLSAYFAENAVSLNLYRNHGNTDLMLIVTMATTLRLSHTQSALYKLNILKKFGMRITSGEDLMIWCWTGNETSGYIRGGNFWPPEQPTASKEGLFSTQSVTKKIFIHVWIISLRDLKKSSEMCAACLLKKFPSRFQTLLPNPQRWLPHQ